LSNYKGQQIFDESRDSCGKKSAHILRGGVMGLDYR